MGQLASKASNETTVSTEVQPKTGTRPTLRSGLEAHLQALKRTSYIQTKDHGLSTLGRDTSPETTPYTSRGTDTNPTETEKEKEKETKLPPILHIPPKPSPLWNLRQRLHLQYPPLQQRHQRDLAYPRFDRTTAPRQRDEIKKREQWLRAFLHEFDLVFVVDDSTSMLGERWREVQNAVAGMAMLCGVLGLDGVDVFFVNHWAGSRDRAGEDNGEENNDDDGELGGYTNLTNASQVHAIFNQIRPCGRTPFGARLGHLFLPYLHHVENVSMSMSMVRSVADDGLASHFPPPPPPAEKNRGSQNTNATVGRVKPLYIVGITDGAFTDDTEEILLQTARRLQGCQAVPWQISVQFFRVGEDEGARRFLEALEGALRRRGRAQGITRDVLVVGGKMGMGKRMTAYGMVQRMMGGVQSVVSAQVKP